MDSVSRQGKGKRAKEEKILAVHEGWRRNGSQLELVNRRHCLHEGTGDVWERFEEWLMQEYAYDPCRELLVINGDAASWITACREYVGKRACFQLDRFHVARELRQCLSSHPRWREVRKKLAKQDEEGLLVELNSAVGTLKDEAKEQQLSAMIRRIESMPGCIREGLPGVAVGARGGDDRHASDGPRRERDEPVCASGEIPPQLERPRVSGVSEGDGSPNRRDWVEKGTVGGGRAPEGSLGLDEVQAG